MLTMCIQQSLRTVGPGTYAFILGTLAIQSSWTQGCGMISVSWGCLAVFYRSFTGTSPSPRMSEANALKVKSQEFKIPWRISPAPVVLCSACGHGLPYTRSSAEWCSEKWLSNSAVMHASQLFYSLTLLAKKLIVKTHILFYIIWERHCFKNIWIAFK